MDGIHDLGGMMGFGAVEREDAEPVFHAAWEGRVFAMAALSPGAPANIDAFRHAIERLPPVEYLTRGYYGRWLAALERQLIRAGALDAGEVQARYRERGTGSLPDLDPPGPDMTGGKALPEPEIAGDSRRPVAAAPRFSVGDKVRAKNIHPHGHTRLPRYVRAKTGEVVRLQGGWVFPDTNAHGLGEKPQHVYCVRFNGQELWGDDAEPGTVVHIDLFDDYLEPA